MAKVTVSLSENEKSEWQNYAQTKGLKTIAGLIRFATMQYMTRYPLKSEGCTARRQSGEK